MNDLNDLLDLYLVLEAEIAGYWNVFITVNTVIFGWLVTKRGRHEIGPRAMAAVAYAVFAVLLFVTVELNLPMFDAVRHDVTIAAEPLDSFVKNTRLQTQLTNLPGGERYALWRWIYLASALCVAVFIFLDVLCRPENGAKVTKQDKASSPN